MLEETMLQFKDKIKKLRKEKDMTQEQLAEYMGGIASSRQSLGNRGYLSRYFCVARFG